jgi:hypothetical protein
VGGGLKPSPLSPRKGKKEHVCQFSEVCEHVMMILFAVINYELELWLRGKRID